MMRSGKSRGSGHVLRLIPLFLSLSFCASKPDITGKWKEVGKMAAMEFSRDGTFRAVDNQGMSVSGTYALLKDGHLQCKIQHREGPEEIVDVTIAIKGDELTIASSIDADVEHYRREK